jgi:uncharacterized protein
MTNTSLTTSIRDDTSSDDLIAWLEARLGPSHALDRLTREIATEAAAKGGLRALLSLQGFVDALVLHVLRVSGMIVRGRANAARIEVVYNEFRPVGLPAAFDGFTILHLTDLHADVSETAMRALPSAIRELRYDVCVMTGDFRGKTFGPFHRALDLIGEVVSGIRKPIYGILGNHDSATMIPGLEDMGIRMLMNEAEAITCGSDKLWIAGVDDPYHYKAHDLRKALAGIPKEEPTILLSHSADGHQNAEQAGVNVMLSGHTHGGQICLPGAFPIFTCSSLPRNMAAGRWRHGTMDGYTSRGVGTSVVDVRFNCPPEVALHRLAVVPAHSGLIRV